MERKKKKVSHESLEFSSSPQNYEFLISYKLEKSPKTLVFHVLATFPLVLYEVISTVDVLRGKRAGQKSVNKVIWLV